MNTDRDTDPAPTCDDEVSQAEIFASLVKNMLEPLRADIAKCLDATARSESIARQCFEAVLRVEVAQSQLRRDHDTLVARVAAIEAALAERARLP